MVARQHSFRVLAVLAAALSACSDDDGASVCGDGVAEGTEVCDGSDLRGHDCTTVDSHFFLTLGLACQSDCTFDTSGCRLPECGNGLLEPGEACDGVELGEHDCVDLGFHGGDLGCTEDCRLDVSACTMDESVCGDGVAEGYESCDGSDLGDQTCVTASARYVGGVLRCNEACGFDTSACVEPTCGDGVAAGLEACDGADLRGKTCADVGYQRGVLGCAAGCLLDASGCLRDPVCGNAEAEPGEACDAGDLGGQDCVHFGFEWGTLGCRADCRLDFSGCAGDRCALLDLYGDGWCDDCAAYGGSPDPDCERCALADGACSPPDQVDELTGVSTCLQVTGARDPDCGPCGDGVRSAAEACDGTDLGGRDCRDHGWSGGALGCDASCRVDLTGCVGWCGDGQRGGAERCDGGDLGGETCGTLGLGMGALGCRGNCTYDLGGCSDAPPEGICGDGWIGGWEACDGEDLGELTCVDAGFAGGVLRCQTDCQYDFSGCLGDLCALQGWYGDGACDLCERYHGGPDADCDRCAITDGACSGPTGPDYLDPYTYLSTCQQATGASDPDCGVCGDGVRSAIELCDGTDLDFWTCEHLGLTGTGLTCDASCRPDPSGCSGP